MTVKVSDIKAVLSELGDDEEVVIRIRPAMSDLDIGTVTINRVKYVELVYNVAWRPRELKVKR